MTKLVQNDLTSLVNEQSALAALNANYNSLELFSDTVLSRDGTTPNQMMADLDMNSKKILNIGDPLDMNHAAIIGLDDAVALDEPVTLNQLNNAILSGGGAIATADYITISNTPFLPNERKLAATGAGVSLTDGGAGGSITIDLDNDLDAIAALATTGLATRTAADTWVTRTLTAPAAGITITNPAGIAGNPTLVLANDLSAVEGLASNGLVTRTATDAWTTRTLTQPAAGITVSNGDGIAGNPTLALANDLSAVEGLAANGMVARTATDTWTVRTIAGTANEITLTNGDGVAAAPTVSIPTSVTFTGKTITGGTYNTATTTGVFDIHESLNLTGDISPASFGTTQNDYNPASLNVSTTLRLTSSANSDVTGLAGGADGRIIIIHNIGATFTIVLKNESASSTAANRFNLSADVTLSPGNAMMLQYDATSSRWRALGGTGGGAGGGAATTEAYVTIGNTAGLTAERALTAGQGVTITDGGANTTVTVETVNGSVLQTLQNTYTTNAALSTAIPDDDTVPTNTEGTQILSQAITPADNTNKVLCEVSVQGAFDSLQTSVATVLFRGSTAIAAAYGDINSISNVTGLTGPMAHSIIFLDSPASAAAQTYTVRVGQSAGTMRLNGNLGGRKLGGVSVCTLTVKEIKA